MWSARRKFAWRALSAGAAGAMFALVAVMSLSSTAIADEVQWNRNKGDCEFVLKAPDRYPLDSINECTMLWEQYKDVKGLSPDERSLFARGFSWLFLYGRGNQKAVAKGALGRLGKPQPLCFVDGTWRDPNIGQKCTTDGEVAAAAGEVRLLPQVTPAKPSRGALAQANRFNSQGLRQYKRRRYAAAVDLFTRALGKDPFHAKAKYNLACNLALLGDGDGAVQALLELQSWDSTDARAQFAKARSDSDFEPIHNNARFRRLVGLVRIQLLNGAGEPGLFHVGRIRKSLISRNFYVAQYGFDRYTRTRPLIYYRKGYEAQAQMAKEIVANIRTATLEIQWDSPFDLIIVWGDPDVAAKAGASGPIVQGEEVKDKGDASKEFLDKFNDAKGKADEFNKAATDTPALPGAP